MKLLNKEKMYAITSNIQNNMVLNKGLLELGGYAIPSVIMANNKVEARERAERSAGLFSVAYLTPLILLPLFNKSFLKLNKITDKLADRSSIILVSKKYLTKDGKYLEEGINELLKSLETKKNYNEIKTSLQDILKKFPDKEILRKKLIKTHAQVILSDFLATGFMFGSVYWSSNFLTKKKTGKDGFSAKFEMVDDKTLKENAKKHEQGKYKKMFLAIGLILAGGFGLSSALKRGISTPKISKFGNFMKKYADKFDYTDGIFMSRATFFGINLFSDLPNTLLASRDKEELKYNIIKNIAFIATFFGGDLVLNNLSARLIDKAISTKLIDDSKVKEKNTIWNKINSPLRSFKDIAENKIKLDGKALQKTKTAGVAMFWWNFAVLCAICGFGLPYMLNKILRKDVAKNKESANNIQAETFDAKSKKAFEKF